MNNIKLGTHEVTLQHIKVGGFDENNGDPTLLLESTDKNNGLWMEVDSAELAQSIAYLDNDTDGKQTAAKFLDDMIKYSDDILGDQLFEMCKVLLKACIRNVNKNEGLYYRPLKAAEAVLDDIIENCI